MVRTSLDSQAHEIAGCLMAGPDSLTWDRDMQMMVFKSNVAFFRVGLPQCKNLARFSGCFNYGRVSQK